MEFSATNLLIIAILVLVSVQTFQLVNILSTVSSLSAGGVATSAAGASKSGSQISGVGGC